MGWLFFGSTKKYISESPKEFLRGFGNIFKPSFYILINRLRIYHTTFKFILLTEKPSI